MEASDWLWTLLKGTASWKQEEWEWEGLGRSDGRTVGMERRPLLKLMAMFKLLQGVWRATRGRYGGNEALREDEKKMLINE